MFEVDFGDYGMTVVFARDANGARASLERSKLLGDKSARKGNVAYWWPKPVRRDLGVDKLARCLSEART